MFWLWDMSYEIWVMSYEIWIWYDILEAMGYFEVMGYGLWV